MTEWWQRDFRKSYAQRAVEIFEEVYRGTKRVGYYLNECSDSGRDPEEVTLWAKRSEELLAGLATAEEKVKELERKIKEWADNCPIEDEDEQENEECLIP